ncbi:MAG: NAD(P)H-dependent oxidoreductase [Actinomycetota bacterium]|nr:NAD(P)H-dependent oxidoreductase [Actinomycetota bacterium]
MKALIVYVHPVEDSFNSAVRDAVISDLTAASHVVRLRDLYAENFNPFLSAAERALHHTSPTTRPELTRDVEDLRWCEAIVFVYPTWWAGLPAMLKGWIDRTWMNEVAWVLPAGANTIRPRLTNITRLVAVTTHGSSKFVNALQGEPGKRIITRSIRVMCNRWCRARWIARYGLDKSTAQDRQHHLETVGQRVVNALR